MNHREGICSSKGPKTIEELRGSWTHLKVSARSARSWFPPLKNLASSGSCPSSPSLTCNKRHFWRIKIPYPGLLMLYRGIDLFFVSDGKDLTLKIFTVISVFPDFNNARVSDNRCRDYVIACFPISWSLMSKVRHEHALMRLHLLEEQQWAVKTMLNIPINLCDFQSFHLRERLKLKLSGLATWSLAKITCFQ